MTTYLLDVNVLIALLSSKHDHHLRARSWFEAEGHQAWLTCPTTESGVVRIMSSPAFSKAGVTPGTVIETLETLCSIGNHRFVPNNLSLTDGDVFIRSQLLASRQVTDAYLLSIAVRNGAMLATFDQRIVASAVQQGEHHLFVI